MFVAPLVGPYSGVAEYSCGSAMSYRIVARSRLRQTKFTDAVPSLMEVAARRRRSRMPMVMLFRAPLRYRARIVSAGTLNASFAAQLGHQHIPELGTRIPDAPLTHLSFTPTSTLCWSRSSAGLQLYAPKSSKSASPTTASTGSLSSNDFCCLSGELCERFERAPPPLLVCAQLPFFEKREREKAQTHLEHQYEGMCV